MNDNSRRLDGLVYPHDAVDVMTNGFDVVEATNADEAIFRPRTSLRHHSRFH
jgi:hypothetical protein